MRKRLNALIMLVLASTMLIGCGSSSNDNSESKGNDTEVTENQSTNETSEEETENSESASEEETGEKLKYDWNGEFNLSEGTGSLKITQKDENTFDFEITGEKGDKKIDETKGSASIDEDFASYKYEDGKTMSFFIVARSSVEVAVFSSDGEEVFSGSYAIK